MPVQDLLLLLVRGTNLSIVPDPAIGGTFIGELKNVTVRQALGLILRPLGLDYALDGSVIRVFRREAETRIFDLNYIATERAGAVDGRRRRRIADQRERHDRDQGRRVRRARQRRAHAAHRARDASTSIARPGCCR